MAIVYCNDDGSNTSPYDTMAKAATSFATAVSQAAAGDDIYVGHDHTETLSANTVYTFSGTAASPVRVFSVNTSTEAYQRATSVQINAGNSTYDLTLSGDYAIYGMFFECGDDFNMVDGQERMYLEDCEIEMVRVSSANLFLGVNTGSVVHLKGCTINFTSGSTSSNIIPWNGGITLEDCTVEWTGTQPDELFTASDRFVNLHIKGGDYSSISSTLFNLSGDPNFTILMERALLNSSVTLFNSTRPDYPGAWALVKECDDTTGNDVYRMELFEYYGDITSDDATYRSGGASDGTTNISWKMVSTGSATDGNVNEYLKSPPIVLWNTATSSSTFTINCLWDSATNIQNDEIWMELEYFGSSANTQSSFSSDGLANPLATAADQTTNSETWTISPSMTNANEFQLNVTVTPGRVGPEVASDCSLEYRN